MWAFILKSRLNELYIKLTKIECGNWKLCITSYIKAPFYFYMIDFNIWIEHKKTKLSRPPKIVHVLRIISEILLRINKSTFSPRVIERSTSYFFFHRSLIDLRITKTETISYRDKKISFQICSCTISCRRTSFCESLNYESHVVDKSKINVEVPSFTVRIWPRGTYVDEWWECDSRNHISHIIEVDDAFFE